MKNIVTLEMYYTPEALRSEIAAFVSYYNNHRYHEALDNVTPADMYFGRAAEILEKRKRIKKRTMKLRRAQNCGRVKRKKLHENRVT
jgi:hypothetical protein